MNSLVPLLCRFGMSLDCGDKGGDCMPNEKSGRLLLSPWELLDLSFRPALISTAD
jgi:hypothetical protein